MNIQIKHIVLIIFVVGINHHSYSSLLNSDKFSEDIIRSEGYFNGEVGVGSFSDNLPSQNSLSGVIRSLTDSDGLPDPGNNGDGPPPPPLGPVPIPVKDCWEILLLLSSVFVVVIKWKNRKKIINTTT